MTSISDQERLGRLRRGIGASAVSRAVAATVPLVTIPISLDHLGVTAYGAWSAALALTGFAAFADLGLGAGLMTRLAAALSDQQHKAARVLVSSAYVALTAVVAAIVATLWMSSIWVDYGVMLGADRSSTELTNIVIVTLSVFVANIVASLIVRIQYAAQQIGWSNMWQCAGSASSVIATLIAASTAARAPLFIAIATGVPLLVAAVNSVHFFLRGPGREYRPSVHAFEVRAALSLLRLGSGFLVINVFIAAATTTDSLIVSNTTSLESVPNYAIPARVFSIMAVATAVFSGPLWPINVEAMKRGDIAWVKTTTARMAVLTGSISLILGVVGIVAGQAVISVWLGGAVTVSPVLLTGLAASLFVQSVTSPYFMVQNAMSVLSPQILGYALLTMTIPIKWVISARAGYDYIPFVSAAGFILFVWPAVYRGYRRAMAVTVEIRGH